MYNFSVAGINVPTNFSGSEYRTHCPQCANAHNNSNKTLSCNIDRGLYNCFRCGWKGKVGNNNTLVTGILQKKYSDKLSKQDKRKRASIIITSGEAVSLTHPNALPIILYLSKRLGHDLPGLPNLKAHPQLTYFYGKKYIGKFPAMLGEIVSENDELITLHRTYLTQQGDKAPVESVKKLMSTPSDNNCLGGAIRLYQPNDTLIISEGIETALALHIALQEPAWACYSAHALSRVGIPNDVRTVIIGADNDKSGTGQAHAHKLQHRLLSEGYKVKVLIPPRRDTDWLDVLREKNL